LASDQKPIEGVSMLYSFDQPVAPSTRTTQYFEVLENPAFTMMAGSHAQLLRAPLECEYSRRRCPFGTTMTATRQLNVPLQQISATTASPSVTSTEPVSLFYKYVAPSGRDVLFTLDAFAAQPLSGGILDCIPPQQTTSKHINNQRLKVTHYSGCT
jgi:hypothetical protein